ncbi:hypothetical protein ACFUTY_15170 [Streptomyces sp. NPDC057362]|uniref:hypothetical protein n=1 Tax=Streptomyces sp. NPDC057362 TaxID=3346106 RepID=UPI00362F51C6
MIVQEAPRCYTGPIILTLDVLTGSVALLLVIAFVVQVLGCAAVAVPSATGDLSYTINRTSKRKTPYSK